MEACTSDFSYLAGEPTPPATATCSCNCSGLTFLADGCCNLSDHQSACRLGWTAFASNYYSRTADIDNVAAILGHAFAGSTLVPLPPPAPTLTLAGLSPDTCYARWLASLALELAVQCPGGHPRRTLQA